MPNKIQSDFCHDVAASLRKEDRNDSAMIRTACNDLADHYIRSGAIKESTWAKWSQGFMVKRIKTILKNR